MGKNMFDNKIISKALSECLTKEDIEKLFEMFEVKSKQTRINLLNDCMGNPQTFFSSGDVDLHNKYELTIQMFLTGSWKINLYYEKMGIRAVSNA